MSSHYFTPHSHVALRLAAVLLLCALWGCGPSPSVRFEDVHVSISTSAAPASAPVAGGDLEAADAGFPAAESTPGAASRTAPNRTRELHDPLVDDGGAWNAPNEDVRQQQPHTEVSGTLTAGSLDDQQNWDEFQSYLASSHSLADRFQWPAELGPRAVVEVRDSEGRPASGAKLVIHAIDEQGIPNPTSTIPLTTGSDGRALFLAGWDAPGVRTPRRFQLTATSADGRAVAHRHVQMGEENWTINLDHSGVLRPTKLDLALVVDATGSMGDELTYLQNELQAIVREIARRFPHVDCRFALVVYRDQGDAFISRTYGFTGNLSQFQADLAEQRAVGGGDQPEAVHAALDQTALLDWRSGDAVKVAFWVADAPPHARFGKQTLSAVQKLRSQGVRLYPIGASGVADAAEYVMRVSAAATMGEYLFLTDHSGVGHAHAAPQASQYAVEMLDQLMLRKLSEELTGRGLAPREVVAYGGEQSQSLQSPSASNAWNWPASPRWLVLAAALASILMVDAWSRRA